MKFKIKYNKDIQIQTFTLTNNKGNLKIYGHGFNSIKESVLLKIISEK